MNANRMPRRYFLGCAVYGALSAAGCASLPANRPRKRPNFVFVLIDDLGYTDLGCFGSAFHETPNIDRLAASGLRFTDAYAACPVCSPTRASIMTGKYPARLKLTNFLKGVKSPKESPVLTAPYADELALGEMTIAEILRQEGYVTGHIGKWHLGAKGFFPEDQGFDINVGGCASGMPRSFYWPEWGNNPPIHGEFGGEYLTDRLSKEACNFIEANKTRPFYLNLCHYSVHIPLQAKPEIRAKYEAKLKTHPPAPGQQNNPIYAAMIESIDEGIGLLIETLERCGIAENTIIFFFSDNGGLSVKEGENTPATTNAPLRDGKGYLHEGGIREPLIVSWPAGIRPGSVCATPVSSIDFFPTICALAGASPESAGARDIDGVDLSRLLYKPDTPLDRPLFWHYPHFANQGGRPGGAVRLGPWKLIENYEFGNLELYNLKSDIGETHNLAQTEPGRARKMLNTLRRWRAQVNAAMPPPNPEYNAPTP